MNLRKFLRVLQILVLNQYFFLNHIFVKFAIKSQLKKNVDVVKSIANVERDPRDKPLEDVVIQEVTIYRD